MKVLSSIVVPCASGVAFSAYNRCGEKGLLPGRFGWISPSLTSGACLTAGMAACSLITRSPLKAFGITAFVLSHIAITNSLREVRKNRAEWDLSRQDLMDRRVIELFEKTKPDE